MMQVALRGLWGRKLRTVLTALSIVLGTAMITGTFILRDQINNAFSDIFHESNQGIDVVLSKKTAFTSDNGTVAGPLPESAIAIAKTADGVDKVEGQIQATGSIVVDGKYVTGSGGAPNLVFSYVTEPFSNSQFIAGGPPTDNTVAINQKLANDEHLKTGDRVKLATDTGEVPVTISGVFKLAGVSSIGGATLVVPTFHNAQQWYDRVGKTSVVYLSAQPGVSPAQLKSNVQAVVPDDVKVQTGQENADQQTSDVEGATSFLTYILLAFAGAAVFVGLFIIFNTYSITVAQRMREFAMLRTLGASRRQVMRSVLLEAALMGLAASLIGIGFGVLLAIGLNALFKAVGVDLPTAALTIPIVWSVLLPLAVGLGAALVASVAPAVKATRVPPIAALREGFTLPAGKLAPYIPYIGVGMAILGVGVIAFAIRAGGGGSRVLLTMAAGAIIAFLGMSMLSQLLIVPIAAALGVGPRGGASALEVPGPDPRPHSGARTRDPTGGLRAHAGLRLGRDHHGADPDLDPPWRHLGRHAGRDRRRAGDRRDDLLRHVEAAAARVAVGRVLADRRACSPARTPRGIPTAPPSRRRRS